MTNSLIQASNQIGPAEGAISIVTMSASSVAATIASIPALLAAQGSGDYVSLYCTTLVYFKFAPSATNAVDENAVAGPTQCFILPADRLVRVKVPNGCTHFTTKGTAAALLRIAISSSMRM